MRFIRKKNNIPPRRMASVNAPVPSDTFRRNRTITGVESIQSPRTHIHHLTMRRRKVSSILVGIVLSIILLFILVTNFTASPAVIISAADNDTTGVDLTRYSKVIQSYFGLNPLQRFLFLQDNSSFISYVSSKLPEVGTITPIRMKRIGEIEYNLVMRKPVAGWKFNNKQYYVDLFGMPFEKNYFSEPDVKIVDNTGVPVTTGTAAVSRRLLRFVGLVVSSAMASGHTVTAAVLPSGTMRELDVTLSDTTSVVKLSIDRAVGEQIEDMARSIDYFKSVGQVPPYIDVRVSGKAFFR